MTRTVAAALAGAVIVIALLVLAIGSGAFAQAANRDLLRTACMDDYKKFCAGVQPGGGRILQCLREREKELTPACRDGLAKTGR